MKLIHLENWSGIKQFIDCLSSDDEYLWRGHSSANWILSSSLYRYFINNNIQIDKRIELETKSIQSFREDYIFQGERNLANERNCNTSLMIKMQHFGCPTRMLDWAISPYIAFYFSIQEMQDFAAIFVLNLTKYQNFISPKLPMDDYDQSLLTFIPDRYLRIILKSTDFNLPIPICPTWITEREYNQQSCFLMDVDINKSTEKYFDTIQDEYITKIIFPKKIRNTIYKDLLLMNIDGYHLFGGIQGRALRAKEALFGVPLSGHSIETIDLY